MVLKSDAVTPAPSEVVASSSVADTTKAELVLVRVENDPSTELQTNACPETPEVAALSCDSIVTLGQKDDVKEVTTTPISTSCFPDFTACIRSTRERLLNHNQVTQNLRADDTELEPLQQALGFKAETQASSVVTQQPFSIRQFVLNHQDHPQDHQQEEVSCTDIDPTGCFGQNFPRLTSYYNTSSKRIRNCLSRNTARLPTHVSIFRQEIPFVGTKKGETSVGAKVRPIFAQANKQIDKAVDRVLDLEIGKTNLLKPLAKVQTTFKAGVNCSIAIKYETSDDESDDELATTSADKTKEKKGAEEKAPEEKAPEISGEEGADPKTEEKEEPKPEDNQENKTEDESGEAKTEQTENEGNEVAEKAESLKEEAGTDADNAEDNKDKAESEKDKKVTQDTEVLASTSASNAETGEDAKTSAHRKKREKVNYTTSYTSPRFTLPLSSKLQFFETVEGGGQIYSVWAMSVDTGFNYQLEFLKGQEIMAMPVTDLDEESRKECKGIDKYAQCYGVALDNMVIIQAKQKDTTNGYDPQPYDSSPPSDLGIVELVVDKTLLASKASLIMASDNA